MNKTAIATTRAMVATTPPPMFFPLSNAFPVGITLTTMAIVEVNIAPLIRNEALSLNAMTIKTTPMIAAGNPNANPISSVRDLYKLEEIMIKMLKASITNNKILKAIAITFYPLSVVL